MLEVLVSPDDEGGKDANAISISINCLYEWLFFRLVAANDDSATEIVLGMRMIEHATQC